eukprot:1187121-Prorocentrum_minimum.AAC.1
MVHIEEPFWYSVTAGDVVSAGTADDAPPGAANRIATGVVPAGGWLRSRPLVASSTVDSAHTLRFPEGIPIPAFEPTLPHKPPGNKPPNPPRTPLDPLGPPCIPIPAFEPPLPHAPPGFRPKPRKPPNWQGRLAQIVWRGSSTGHPIMMKNRRWWQNQRVQLVNLSKFVQAKNVR